MKQDRFLFEYTYNGVRWEQNITGKNRKDAYIKFVTYTAFDSIEKITLLLNKVQNDEPSVATESASSNVADNQIKIKPEGNTAQKDWRKHPNYNWFDGHEKRVIEQIVQMAIAATHPDKDNGI